MAIFKKKNIDGSGDDGVSMLFYVAGEAIAENGEDSFCIDAKDNRALTAVFDGCGGIGAKRYQNYHGKTGAYVASRAVAGSLGRWFARGAEDQVLDYYVGTALHICMQYGDQQISRIKGSLGKAFPTTMAVTSSSDDTDSINVMCFWSGDSRCYLLDTSGLHQLTKDDTQTQSAMSNLTDDGVLTNVINGSVPYEIHRKSYTFPKPCIVFSATDGCFGYITTPMEFEFLLLKTMTESTCIIDWKKRLYCLFSEVSGDDFTMCLAGYGFKTFLDVKACYRERYLELEKLLDSGVAREDMWELYSNGYESYL